MTRRRNEHEAGADTTAVLEDLPLECNLGRSSGNTIHAARTMCELGLRSYLDVRRPEQWARGLRLRVVAAGRARPARRVDLCASVARISLNFSTYTICFWFLA